MTTTMNATHALAYHSDGAAAPGSSKTSPPMITALLDDGRYMYATCGMHPALLAKLRAAVGDIDSLRRLCEELVSHASSRLQYSPLDTAVIVAPPVGPALCTAGGTDPLVVVWLLLDPLDIDSKQTTFCREASRDMKLLYKWTGTKAAPPYTVLPTSIPEG